MHGPAAVVAAGALVSAGAEAPMSRSNISPHPAIAPGRRSRRSAPASSGSAADVPARRGHGLRRVGLLRLGFRRRLLAFSLGATTAAAVRLAVGLAGGARRGDGVEQALGLAQVDARCVLLHVVGGLDRLLQLRSRGAELGGGAQLALDVRDVVRAERGAERGERLLEP